MDAFSSHHGQLRCSDCQTEISTEAYRRKVPRCDACEARAWMRTLRRQLEDWNRVARGLVPRHP